MTQINTAHGSRHESVNFCYTVLKVAIIILVTFETIGLIAKVVSMLSYPDDYKSNDGETAYYLYLIILMLKILFNFALIGMVLCECTCPLLVVTLLFVAFFAWHTYDKHKADELSAALSDWIYLSGIIKVCLLLVYVLLLCLFKVE